MDTSVYDALVRMAQDFNMRYTLVDGHGNFGSPDGDGAAAMRYTESRMENLTLLMIKDIEKNIIDFIPNFDGEEKEPSVLPSRFPNLIVNGSEGIAVGMATKIPSHNLNEVVNGIEYLLDNENCGVEDLINYIPAPDFPTYGNIINPKEIINIYKKGTGNIILRATYKFEYDDKNKRIVFTDIPYQKNKVKICESITNIVLDKSDNILKNISDVREESDRDGIRVVVEFKRNCDENQILARLFQKTELQTNYNCIFRAIVDGQPFLLNLKQILEYYIQHQKEVLTRRTQFDLNKANDRLHILEGLIKALDNLDETVDIIKKSKTTDEAREKLKSFLQVDKIQADYILELKLRRLTGMEIDSVKSEHLELTNLVIKLKNILDNESELINLLKTELIEIRDKYGDERRTKLIYEDTIQDISREDLIEDGSVTLCLTKESWLKKSLMYADADKHKVKEGDEVIQLYKTTNKSDLLMFTSQGRVFSRKVYDFEEKKPSVLGEYLANILDLNQDEKVIYICTTKDYSGSILFCYENGNIAKTKLSAYQPKNNRQKAIDAYNTESKLVGIGLAEKEVDILLISDNGKGSIIDSSRIKAKSSRAIQGNCGIKLDDECKVIKAIVNPNKELNFTMTTEKGKEKVYYLDDVAETAQVEKNWYDHLRGSGSIKSGNFLYNCRTKNDKIVDIIINK